MFIFIATHGKKKLHRSLEIRSRFRSRLILRILCHLLHSSHKWDERETNAYLDHHTHLVFCFFLSRYSVEGR